MMCPISNLKCSSSIYMATVALSIVYTFAQETPTRREINSTDCSGQIYPNVNITSDFSHTDVSSAKLIMTDNSSVTLTCYEFYPVEWVFQERPSDDVVASLRERREWVASSNGEFLERYSIDVTLNFTTNGLNITCRAIEEGEVCRQTTVKFVRAAEINGSNTSNATVYKGLPRGELLQEYGPLYEASNINCSLQLRYNGGDEQFECHSKNKDQTVYLQESDNFSRGLCYDWFSCGLLYNRKETYYCNNQSQNEKYLRAILPRSAYSGNFTGIVTCKLPVDSEQDGRVNEYSRMVTSFSHFIHPFHMPCKWGSDDDFIGPIGRHIYLDLDPSSLSEKQSLDFIRVCSILQPIIGYTSNITCHTSVYIFAEGVQMKIKMWNGSETDVTDISLLNVDNPSKINKNGYRTYIASISINSRQMREVSCSAPLRKSKTWIVKSSRLTVRNPEPLEFEGNISNTTVWVQRDRDVELNCWAYGSPLPSDYEWKYSVTDTPFPDEWIESDGRVLTIPSRNTSILYTNAVLCTARSTLGSIVKTFNFIFEGSNSSILQTSGYVEKNWFAIVITVTVILLIAVGGIIAFLVWKIFHQRRNLSLLSQVEIDGFMNGNPRAFINSTNDSEYDINSYSSCLPYDRDFEVMKEHLDLDQSTVIGSGAYGIVLKGILTTKDTEKVQVAIKTSKPMDDISYLKALMSELKIMGFIGKHDNIVNLLGAYTKNLQNKEIFIAIEYCDNGCLLNYLRSHRESYVDQTLQPNLSASDFITQPNVLTTTCLLRWSMQVSNGMDFLRQKKVIHGDLAARNVLLTSGLTAKIGDFGLSRQLFEYTNYIKQQQSPLPWKWLAIECLRDMTFSPKSDVWAYGVTLWEIFTLGQSPFPGCSFDECFIDSLVGGKRPVQPEYATKELYSLMKECWVIDPSKRPSFPEITVFFDNAVRSITHEEYMNI